MTRRELVSPQFGDGVVPIASAALALAGGVLVVASPTAGVMAAATIALLLAVAQLQIRYFVGALLVFLPFQDLVISRAPAAFVLPARYMPELLVWAIALTLVITRLPTLGRGRALIIACVTGVIVLWCLGGLWNDIDASTILAGVRSEFRFLPLAAVAMVSTRPSADARFYARILLIAGIVQSAIALVEAIGGEGVRAFLSPRYTLVVGGTIVDKVDPPLDTIVGTFAHRNLLGAFLALVGIVIASAGSTGLGLQRRTVILSWGVVAAGTVASTSREGMIALIIGTAFVLGFQHRVFAVKLVLALGAAAIVSILLIRPLADTGPHAGLSSWSRWRDVVSTRGWSATSEANFRLYYLSSSAEFVASEAPVTGFGLGTVSDPRSVQAASSPLENYEAGRFARQAGYYNDGNWTVLLLETGFAGILLLGLLFALLVGFGCNVAEAGFWVGGALAGLVIAIVALGFFAPVLQTRSGSCMLWLFAGLAVASRVGADPRVARPARYRWSEVLR